MDRSRANALVVIDKHRKRKNLLRRSYLKKVKSARQNYKPEDVYAAMRAIYRGMSRRQAAKLFNIPRSTLLDKLDGKRPLDASPGPNPFLTTTEEHILESWAIDLHQRGFPLKTEDLKDMAQAVIQNNQRQTSFRNGRPGRSWMRNFLLRHPRVYDVNTDMNPSPRRSRTVTTREEVRQWCQQHRKFMASKGFEDILDHPDRMFNVDHGEFLFDVGSGHLLEQERFDRCDEKSEHSDQLSSGTECVSIVSTFTAAGGMAPLMIVHPSKDESQEVAEYLPPGWISTHSKSGLLTSKIFLDYIIAFRRWLDQETITLPVVLFVDGRRSRLNMDVTRYCEEQGILLYCLFPTPRPAISELFSSILHDSLDSINKQNFAVRLHEALTTWAESDNTGKVLPHLQSMLQTLAEVRSEPFVNTPSPISFNQQLINNSNFVMSDQQRHCVEVHTHDESDCEFDYDLTPVEGEIEIEFSDVEKCDPHTLALHPALLADPDIPRYLIFERPPKLHASSVPSTPAVDPLAEPDFSEMMPESIQDRIDQPDVKAHLIVKPLSSPLRETDNGIARVESEINDVLDTLLSMGTSHQIKREDFPVVPPPVISEEPFLGFSPDEVRIQQSSLDAHSCLRFMESFLLEKNLLEEFKTACLERQWNGGPEVNLLFQLWLTANDDSRKKLMQPGTDTDTIHAE